MSLNGRAVSAMRTRKLRADAKADRRRQHEFSAVTVDELEAWRAGLALTHDEMAGVCGVSKRMWCAYAARRAPMPIKYEIRIRAYSTLLADLENQYRRALAKAGDQDVVLCWYRSHDEYGDTAAAFAAYQTVVGRLASRVANLRLVTFEQADYTRWLRGRDDADDMRNRWAADRFEFMESRPIQSEYLRRKVSQHIDVLMGKTPPPKRTGPGRPRNPARSEHVVP